MRFPSGSVPVAVALLLALLLGLPERAPEPAGPSSNAAQRTLRAPSEGPNLLIVLADDLGLDALALLGLDPRVPAGLTPNLDALAARGVLFSQAWSNPLCSPTRATLLTGSLPWRTGIGNVIESAAYSLPAEAVTLPEMLREYGPHDIGTAFFGKWHLEFRDSPFDCAPTEVHGFDHFDGHRRQVGPGYQAWPRVTCDAASVAEQGSARGPAPETSSLESRYATECLFASAADWIAGRDRSWLCLLAPEAPYHFPHLPPRGDAALELCERTDRGCWDRTLAEFDARLGRLVDSLGPDWEEHTTIMIAGDNGTPNNVNRHWPEGRAKGTPWEGGVRVPVIVAGRAVDPARRGTTSEELVHVADLFRTAAAVLEVPRLPDHVGPDSFDLGPALRFPPAAVGRELLVSERFKPNGVTAPYVEHDVIVRDRRYKLHWDALAGQPLGFYDLVLDPFEARDLLVHAGRLEAQAEEVLRRLTRAAYTRSVSDS